MDHHDGFEDVISRLQDALDNAANTKTREWWQGYMRGVIPFRGVGIPQIRQLLAQWRSETGIAGWEASRQARLALALFESPVAEDKLSGILFLQEYLYDRLPWQEMLEPYASLFQRSLIFDWNTCDWFCVRVLGPTIEKNGPPCAEAITAWNRAEDLWQARSSVVAFVPVAADLRYHPLIYQSCAVLIRRDERFAKTAVGWILRDLSRHDPDAVRGFADQHLEHFSLEALKNALKYFDLGEQKEFIQRQKAFRR